MTSVIITNQDFAANTFAKVMALVWYNVRPRHKPLLPFCFTVCCLEQPEKLFFKMLESLNLCVYCSFKQSDDC